jgi:hypothetical protein
VPPRHFPPATASRMASQTQASVCSSIRALSISASVGVVGLAIPFSYSEKALAVVVVVVVSTSRGRFLLLLLLTLFCCVLFSTVLFSTVAPLRDCNVARDVTVTDCLRSLNSLCRAALAARLSVSFPPYCHQSWISSTPCSPRSRNPACSRMPTNPAQSPLHCAALLIVLGEACSRLPSGALSSAHSQRQAKWPTICTGDMFSRSAASKVFRWLGSDWCNSIHAMPTPPQPGGSLRRPHRI